MSGRVRAGLQVRLMPVGDVATVKAVLLRGAPVTWARPGDACELVLAGVDATRIDSRCIVCPPHRPIATAKAFVAHVKTLDALAVPFIAGTQVREEGAAGADC